MDTKQRKTLVFGATLFTATVLSLVYLPGLLASSPAQLPANPPEMTAIPEQPNAEQAIVEAVFVLDTTGSMGGLIQAAQEKIWSIAATMASAEPAPEIRMGLVAYRDRGDAFVTKVVDLSSDLDALHAELFQLQAQGGGDGPESVNQALNEAVSMISWGQDRDAYRVIFLVGDAPPHMDYQDDVPYTETLTLARQRGIRVNAIQCGGDRQTLRTWQRIAQLGDGAYAQVTQDGNAVAIATPYDDTLARLSKKLDATRLYYGRAEERAERRERLAKSKAALDAAPAAVLARRATYAASASGKTAILGESELVEEVSSGAVALDEIAPGALPEPLQGLREVEQRQVIAERAELRAKLQEEIEQTAAKRSAYLREKVAERGDFEESLDHKLFDAVREQARASGLRYDADSATY